MTPRVCLFDSNGVSTTVSATVFFVCCMFVMLLSDTSSRTWPENAHMTNATALPSSCCPGLFWTDCKHTVASRGENYGGIDCYIL